MDRQECAEAEDELRLQITSSFHLLLYPIVALKLAMVT